MNEANIKRIRVETIAPNKHGYDAYYVFADNNGMLKTAVMKNQFMVLEFDADNTLASDELYSLCCILHASSGGAATYENKNGFWMQIA